jgi:hypothetical protein
MIPVARLVPTLSARQIRRDHPRRRNHRADHPTTVRPRPEPDATGPNKSGDAMIDAKDRAIDRKLKSICKGC